MEAEEAFVGLTGKDVRRLAYEFTEELGIKHNFSKKYKMAGKDWLHSFMKRNNLSHSTAEFTSSARARGFNPTKVGSLFEKLKKNNGPKKF